jgi:murein DD-endopeptidase MepM/ murein hydrolase activator NlpD
MSIDFFPLRRGPLPARADRVGGWQETSLFGGRIDPLTGRIGTHGGEDLAFGGCSGQEMIAVKSGLLSQGWDSSGGGNWSSLFCDDGDYFGYGHASAFAFPRGGSRWVAAGTVIAYVGTTGGSTGPHLHFAFRPRGASRYADPYDLLHDAADNGRFAGEDPGGNTPDPEPDVPDVPKPKPSEEDEDMLKAPRKSWVTKNGGAWYALNANGRFEYITGPAVLAALQSPSEGWPAEILSPVTIDDGAVEGLAAFYNS